MYPEYKDQPERLADLCRDKVGNFRANITGITILLNKGAKENTRKCKASTKHQQETVQALLGQETPNPAIMLPKYYDSPECKNADAKMQNALFWTSNPSKKRLEYGSGVFFMRDSNLILV